MLQLPIHRYLRVILISPHYPENVGAACRAMKTMGFTRFGLVRPGKLALPTHAMAQKMAVKSWDVLDQAEIFDNVDEAVVGADCVIGTTARRGVSGIFSPSQVADKVLPLAENRKQIVLLFGNEKSGLTNDELKLCDLLLRVPIAADQPSLNLAQAVQVICYELFAHALRLRHVENEDLTDH